MPASSQVSSLVQRGGRGSSTTTTGSGTRPRRPVARMTGNKAINTGLANFYTDDSPGVKLQPVYVVVMSLGFILFVTVLHIVGKIRS